MTTANIHKGKEIADILRLVMKLYRQALEMGLEEQERMILNQLIAVSKDKEEYASVFHACQSVLSDFPEGLPHDSTLIDEAKKRTDVAFRSIFPIDSFDRDMLIYKWFDATIQKLFSKITSFELERVDERIIERLQRSIHNTLVDNPNFKGANPYYKRNYGDYGRAKNCG